MAETWKLWNGRGSTPPRERVAAIRFRDGEERFYTVDGEFWPRWYPWGETDVRTPDDIVAYLPRKEMNDVPNSSD